MSEASEPASNRLYNSLPKNHIRVLRLHGLCIIETPDKPAAQDFAIRCSLDTVPLPGTQDASESTVETVYNAISYVWGKDEPSFRRYVVCNGILWPVTMNLFEALRQFVIHSHPDMLTVWADSICINQANKNEKSQQVAMMGEIYSRAEQVLVWMGTGAGVSDPDVVNFWKYMSSSDQAPGNLTEDMISSTVHFLQCNEWFQRMWTFQEIVLARTALLQLGRYRVSWDDLCRQLPENSMLAAIQASRADKQGNSLLRLIATTWQREARDARDKTYSLLGLYRKKNRLDVDYSGRTAEQVHIDTLIEMSHDVGHLVFPAFLKVSKISLTRSLIRKGYIVLVDWNGKESYPWLLDWARRPDDLDAQVALAHDSEKTAFKFPDFNPNWIKSYRLNGPNIVVAGALCALLKQYRSPRADVWDNGEFWMERLDGPCLTGHSMADLIGWAANCSRGAQDRETQKVFQSQCYLNGNEFYEQFVVRHNMYRSCACYKGGKVKKITEKVSSIFKSQNTQTKKTVIADTTVYSSAARFYRANVDVAKKDPEEYRRRIEFEYAYIAVLFGAKSIVVVRPVWNSTTGRCTFVFKRRLDNHFWERGLRNLALVRPQELPADSDEKIWTDLFSRMSFVPIRMEFEGRDLPEVDSKLRASSETQYEVRGMA